MYPLKQYLICPEKNMNFFRENTDDLSGNFSGTITSEEGFN